MGKQFKVDYFKHLEVFYERIRSEKRIFPVDIALYYAILQKWNREFFNNPLCLIRQELLDLSKISKNTYYKSLQRLKAAKLITYKPGIQGRSLIEITMIPLDNLGAELPSHPVANLGPDSPGLETDLVPNLGPTVKQETYKQQQYNIDEKMNKKMKKDIEELTETFSMAAVSNLRQSNSSYPTQEEVNIFFNQNHASLEEAREFYKENFERGGKFFNNSQKNDWTKVAIRWISRIKNKIRVPKTRDLNYLRDIFLEGKDILMFVDHTHFLAENPMLPAGLFLNIEFVECLCQTSFVADVVQSPNKFIGYCWRKHCFKILPLFIKINNNCIN